MMKLNLILLSSIFLFVACDFSFEATVSYRNSGNESDFDLLYNDQSDYDIPTFVDPSDFSQAPPEKLNDREYVLSYVDHYQDNLSYVSDEFKNDKEIVLKSVSAHGSSLEYASDALKDDKDVVSAAVENFGIALKYASERLRDDKDVVLIAVKAKELVLVYASDRLKNDQEIGLAAVTKFGGSLAIVSSEVRRDEAVIQAALKDQNYSRYILNDDQSDLIALGEETVYNDGSLFELLDEDLKQNEAYILSAIGNFYPAAYQYAQNTSALSQNASALAFAKKAVSIAFYKELYEVMPRSLLEDQSNLIELINAHKIALKDKIKKHVYEGRSNAYFEIFMGQTGIIDAYIISNLSPLAYASDTLKNDPALIDLALDANPLYLSQLTTFTREQVLEAATKNSMIFQYVYHDSFFGYLESNISSEYLQDEEFLFNVISGNLWHDTPDCKMDLQLCTQIFSFIPYLEIDNLPRYEEIVLKAVEFSPFEACIASDDLKAKASFRNQVLEKTSEAYYDQIAECLMLDSL
jgi:hypothetical protein